MDSNGIAYLTGCKSDNPDLWKKSDRLDLALPWLL